MFAVVANGIATYCKTQRQLDTILAIYPYPKFRKVANEAEAMRWLRENSRGQMDIVYKKYGNTSDSCYASVEYFICDDNIYYNIDTSKLGFVKIFPEDAIVDARLNMIKAIVKNVRLDNSLIAHHVIAVNRILKLLGEFVDVDIILPDISVFLALTKYKGKNYIINNTQKLIASRLGGVSYTVKSGISQGE